MELLSKQLCRILPVTWQQPLLTNNDGNPNFHVWRWLENGGYRGGDAWQAFSTASGWGGQWTGGYRNESTMALNLGMWTALPTIVTGISFYIPTVDSAMDWGSCKETRFYGSNDGTNWTQLYSTGHVGQDYQASFTFSNTTKYHYYRFRYLTYGSGHKDYIAICSFRLNAVYEDFV